MVQVHLGLTIFITIKIYINNNEIEVLQNCTIFEACSSIGINLPRFCYHKELSIAGNCRMCLIEIEKLSKPIAACAMPISQNMKIFTDTPLVKKAREGVLELILLNHPLDCPICDQGGECDLQDQVMSFGSDSTRFYEKKRKVEDKNFNPLIKTIMTRCIHCTRCERFASEIIGTDVLGTVNRGQQTEITHYIDTLVFSELSGNLIDLCPVGALTSKPYSYNARPWELKSAESIDIFDALGTLIRVDYKESKIIRILPKFNLELITDKIRFSHDGLFNNRLTQPLEKYINNNLKSISWYQTIKKLLINLKSTNPKKICFILGNNLDSESILASKLLTNNYGISKIVHDRFIKILPTFLNNYTFTLENINKTDFFFIININAQIEAALINLQIQKNVVKKNITSLSTGFIFNSTYKSNKHISLNLFNYLSIFESKSVNSIILKISKSPLLIYGSGLLERIDSLKFLSTLYFCNKNIKIFNQDFINLLVSDSNFIGNNNIGINYFYPELLNSIKILYFVQPNKEILKYINNYINFNNEKELFNNNKSNLYLFNNNPTVIYQSSHFPTVNYNFINYFIPGKTFVEKEGRFFNIENKCQITSKIIHNVNNLQNKDDSQLLQVLNNKYITNFNDKLLELIPSILGLSTFFTNLYFFNKIKFIKTYLKPIMNDFYCNDEITSNSVIMGKMSMIKRKKFTNFF